MSDEPAVRLKRLEDECIALEGVIAHLFQALRTNGHLDQDAINQLFDGVLTHVETRPDPEDGMRRTVERLARLVTPRPKPRG